MTKKRRMNLHHFKKPHTSSHISFQPTNLITLPHHHKLPYQIPTTSLIGKKIEETAAIPTNGVRFMAGCSTQSNAKNIL